VFYSEDGDEETLSQYELNELEIVKDDQQMVVAALTFNASDCRGGD
jgi:hypothetical protein